MKRRARPSHLALLLLFAAGCSVESYLDKIDAEFQQAGEIGCACEGVDQAACQANFTSLFSFVDRACLEDALEQDKKGSKETLRCFLDHIKELNRCLEDKFVCTDPNSIQSCDVDPSDNCPQLPASVQVALNLCGSDAFE